MDGEIEFTISLYKEIRSFNKQLLRMKDDYSVVEMEDDVQKVKNILD